MGSEMCIRDSLWSLDSANFGSAAYSGVIYLDVCEDPVIFGCTDPDYVEYNPEANVDNETCVNLHQLGCIDTSAFNFDTLATIEEIIPTCDYTLIIEDDAGDRWGGCYLGVAQGDSVIGEYYICLLYTSPSPRDLSTSRMPSSA